MHYWAESALFSIKKLVTLRRKNAKMGIPRFFKVSEPKRFDYKPLYWDQEKEDREDRIRRIKAEMGQEVTFGKSSSTIKRGSFRQYSSNSRRKAGRDSNIRLAVIAAALLLLSYLLFYR